ncbi:MJ0042-type zinc finger domain-containing protein [Kitasatospora sp. NPDC091335]|uniref:zinc finger domain-containing protein n=1 Tax=Kitasatospora sp. NPDC091335 TaxID=3364085 RepID=UPI0037FA3862
MAPCQLCTTHDTPGRLCTPCAERLGRHLVDLPHLYTALGAYLRPSSQVRDRLGTVPAGPDAPLPVAEDVLDLIGPGGIVSDLETWREALHQDADIPWPAPWGDLAGRVRRAAVGLRDHLAYIQLDWPVAGQFAFEVAQLHQAAARHIAPTDRPTDIGDHPADPGRPAAEACGGRLQLPHGGTTVRCARCGTTWDQLQWLQLRRRMHHATAGTTAAA